MSKRRSKSYDIRRNFHCGNRLQQLEVAYVKCVSVYTLPTIHVICKCNFSQSRQLFKPCDILCIKNFWASSEEFYLTADIFLTKLQGGCYPHLWNSGENIQPAEYHVNTIPATYWLPQTVASETSTIICAVYCDFKSCTCTSHHQWSNQQFAGWLIANQMRWRSSTIAKQNINDLGLPSSGHPSIQTMPSKLNN